jgi:hypothetical protein
VQILNPFLILLLRLIIHEREGFQTLQIPSHVSDFKILREMEYRVAVSPGALADFPYGGYNGILDEITTVSLLLALLGTGSSKYRCIASGYPLLNRAHLQSMHDASVRHVSSSEALQLFPSNIPALDVLAAVAIMTMGQPLKLEQSINSTLRHLGDGFLNDVCADEFLNIAPFYKLYLLALFSIPKQSKYWFKGVLYRGLSISSSSLDDFRESHNPGCVFTFHHAVSFSDDPCTASNFGNIQFIWPEGEGFLLRDLSFWPSEREVLVGAPSCFKVVTADNVDEKLVFTIQRVPCSFCFLSLPSASAAETEAED